MIGNVAPRPSDAPQDASRAFATSYLVPDSSSSLHPNTWSVYPYHASCKRETVAVLESNIYPLLLDVDNY